jgi:hypothetical protein
MAVVKPYTLDEAQKLTRDALRRTQKMHRVWQDLENLYATGDVEMGATNDKEGDLANQLWGRATLERANVVLPDLNIIIASVGERVPLFVVEPLLIDGNNDEQDNAAAEAAEDLLKYYWRTLHATETIKDMIKDLVVLGPAFCKVGWVFAEMEQDRDVRAILDDEEKAGPGESVPTTEMVTLVDAPFVEYVRPHDVFVPSSCRSLYTARWVCQRVRKPVDELRAEFDIPANIDLATDPIDQEPGIYANKNDENESARMATFFEFYDQRTRMMLVFQEDSREPIFSGPTPTHDGQAPFVMMRNYQRSPLDFYGFGDLMNIAPLQVMLNEIFTLQMDNMRRSGSFVIADEDVLDADSRAALQFPEIGKVFTVKLNGRNIKDAIMDFQMPALPNDVYLAATNVQDLIAQVLGLSEFQMGKSGASRMPGTAAAAIEGHTSLRGSEKQATIARGIASIGEKLLGLAAQSMTEALAIRTVGVDGPLIRRITTDQIDGEFLVSVDAGSVSAINPATRQQRALEKVNVLLPLTRDSGYDVEPLLRSVYRDFGENPDALLRKAPVQPVEAPPVDQTGMGGLPVGEAPIDPSMALTGRPEDLVGGLGSQAFTGQGGPSEY